MGRTWCARAFGGPRLRAARGPHAWAAPVFRGGGAGGEQVVQNKIGARGGEGGGAARREDALRRRRRRTRQGGGAAKEEGLGQKSTSPKKQPRASSPPRQRWQRSDERRGSVYEQECDHERCLLVDTGALTDAVAKVAAVEDAVAREAAAAEALRLQLQLPPQRHPRSCLTRIGEGELVKLGPIFQSLTSTARVRCVDRDNVHRQRAWHGCK